MENLLEYSKYEPADEYKEETRRELDLNIIRKSVPYKRLISYGFKEATSEQQEINNTLKFTRTSEEQYEAGHGKVFYTIHPTGKVRRYNPVRNPENPKEMVEGNGNVIKDFKKPFLKSGDYAKGLKYLCQYIKKKEEREDYR